MQAYGELFDFFLRFAPISDQNIWLYQKIIVFLHRQTRFDTRVPINKISDRRVLPR